LNLSNDPKTYFKIKGAVYLSTAEIPKPNFSVAKTWKIYKKTYMAKKKFFVLTGELETS
jgi:hypothetical protein